MGIQASGALLLLLSAPYNQSFAASPGNKHKEDYSFISMMQSFDNREIEQGFAQLDQLIKQHPNQLDLYRLGLTMGAKFDDYPVIFNAADALLQRQPNDLQALYFKALYSRALTRSDYAQWRNKVASLQPEIAAKLDAMVLEIEAIWQAPVEYSIPDIDPEGVGIIALGSPAEDDGTPKARLLSTLTRTLDLANTFPDAPVFVTGAAVYTSMTEAQAMKSWLIGKGLDENRIIIEDKAVDTIGNAVNISPLLKQKSIDRLLLVTVSYHMRRASLIIDGVFQNKEQAFEVFGVAAQGDLTGQALKQRLQVEKVASYRDLSRAFGLYDFQN